MCGAFRDANLTDTRTQSTLEWEAVELCRRAARRPLWRKLGVTRAREAVEDAEPLSEPVRPPAEAEDIVLPAAGRLGVRIYRPAVAAPLPVVVYLHGAGWVFHGSRGHDVLARELAGRARSAVLMPAFARAPESAYPIALEQCCSLLKWIRRDGQRRGLDPRRIALAGDATGATLATGLALRASEDDTQGLRAQVLLCPATDPGCDTPSHERFADGAYLRRDDVRWLWEHYLPGGDFAEVRAAPLRAALGELAGLPPTLLITAEVDVLRDEGEGYACKLRDAGVKVTAIRYLGTIHGFCHLEALRETAAARAALDQVSAFLTRALGEVAAA